MSMTGSLALVGGGAISEYSYCPALAANPEWLAQTWLVEPNAVRAHALAQKFGFTPAQLVQSLEDLPPSVRFAINATPNHLHLDTTLSLIRRGISVLVEKPFAENAADAVAMLDAARGRCVLSVNQSRRSGPSNMLVRDIIRSGQLGEIRKITWEEGRKFDWPSQSGFNFRRPWNGRARGVLLDIGIHVIDLMCWWLETAPIALSASMDSYGGPEAGVTARLATDQTIIDLRLSFLAKLRNEFLIEGAEGAIRGSTSDYDALEIRTKRGRWRKQKARGVGDNVKAAARLISNVIAASSGKENLIIDAASTIAPLRIVDDLYARAHEVLPECYWEFIERCRTPVAVEMESVK